MKWGINRAPVIMEWGIMQRFDCLIMAKDILASILIQRIRIQGGPFHTYIINVGRHKLRYGHPWKRHKTRDA